MNGFYAQNKPSQAKKPVREAFKDEIYTVSALNLPYVTNSSYSEGLAQKTHYRHL